MIGGTTNVRPKLHKTIPCLANELKPGDKFRITRHSFSPIYVYDYETKIGINAHTVKPDGSIHYVTIGHYDTVGRLEVKE